MRMVLKAIHAEQFPIELLLTKTRNQTSTHQNMEDFDLKKKKYIDIKYINVAVYRDLKWRQLEMAACAVTLHISSYSGRWKVNIPPWGDFTIMNRKEVPALIKPRISAELYMSSFYFKLTQFHMDI